MESSELLQKSNYKPVQQKWLWTLFGILSFLSIVTLLMTIITVTILSLELGEVEVNEIPGNVYPSQFAIPSNRITPVKNVDAKGKSWIFSTIALIESSLRKEAIEKKIINENEYIALSEQAYGKLITQLCSDNNIQKNEEIVNKSIEEKKDYLDITNPFIIRNEDLKEVMFSFRNMVRNSNINLNFVDYASIIRKRLIDEESMEDNYKLINSILDSINYRKLYLKKADKKEKNILRLCINELKELSEQVRIRSIPLAEVHDYKFEMIFELLRDKKNYQLIKKMINDYPAIVNVRNNNRSIVSYILQLYLNNYMMILKEHRYNYNIDYLKEVYKLFVSSSSLYLSGEDKIELDSILDEYIYNLSELDINSKRKNYAINEVKELYIDNISNDNSYQKNIDKYMFDANIKDIKFLDPNHSKRNTEIDLTNEHTFMLENPYICYSFNEEKGNKSLKIHTADFSNIVEESSALDKYTFNCLINNKKINSTLSDYLEFKKDDIVSAFTYEIIMDNDRNIKDFKIYKSRIKVDGGILDYSNNQYVYQNLRRIINDYIQDFGDVKLTGLSKIEYILNDILKKQYLKLSRKNNLPILVEKEDKVDLIDSETFSNIKNIFNKLNKRDYKKLSKIFETKIEEKYYESRTRYDKIGELNISGNPNYIYLLNQRMLKTLLLNDHPISQEMYSSIKQKTIEEYDNLIKVLNDISGHKTDADFDYKKRRNFKSYVLKNEE